MTEDDRAWNLLSTLAEIEAASPEIDPPTDAQIVEARQVRVTMRAAARLAHLPLVAAVAAQQAIDAGGKITAYCSDSETPWIALGDIPAALYLMLRGAGFFPMPDSDSCDGTTVQMYWEQHGYNRRHGHACVCPGCTDVCCCGIDLKHHHGEEHMFVSVGAPR